MDIRKLNPFFETELEIDVSNFNLFMGYSNYPCDSLTIYLAEEDCIDEQHKLEYVQKAFPVAKSLEKFNLYVDLFDSVPSLKNFKYLQVCVIENPLMKRFDYNFRFNKHLKELAITAPLEFIYKYSFVTNSNLKYLRLKNFKVRKEILQECIGKISNLERLYLVNCNLKEFELENVKCLDSLQSISFCDNKLKKIPSFLQKCKYINIVDICNNQIQSIDECNWLQNSYVRRLCLKKNCLTHLPNFLQNMKHLQHLIIPYNKFKETIPFVFKKEFIDNVSIDTSQRIFTEEKYKLFKYLQNHPEDDLFENTELFQCPISKNIMIDPVSTENGHTYEKFSIETWLKKKNTDPISGQTLNSKKLVPNLALFSIISSTIDKKMK